MHGQGGTGSSRLVARQEPCRERRAGRGTISNNGSAIEQQRRVPDMTCSREAVSSAAPSNDHSPKTAAVRWLTWWVVGGRWEVVGGSVASWAPVWQSTDGFIGLIDEIERSCQATGSPCCQR
jgi:hypothetical protein